MAAGVVVVEDDVDDLVALEDEGVGVGGVDGGVGGICTGREGGVEGGDFGGDVGDGVEGGAGGGINGMGRRGWRGGLASLRRRLGLSLGR